MQQRAEYVCNKTTKKTFSTTYNNNSNNNATGTRLNTQVSILPSLYKMSFFFLFFQLRISFYPHSTTTATNVCRGGSITPEASASVGIIFYIELLLCIVSKQQRPKKGDRLTFSPFEKKKKGANSTA